MILLTLSEDNQTSPNISYDSCGLIDDRCDIIHKKTGAYRSWRSSRGPLYIGFRQCEQVGVQPQRTTQHSSVSSPQTVENTITWIIYDPLQTCFFHSKQTIHFAVPPFQETTINVHIYIYLNIYVYIICTQLYIYSSNIHPARAWPCCIKHSPLVTNIRFCVLFFVKDFHIAVNPGTNHTSHLDASENVRFPTTIISTATHYKPLDARVSVCRTNPCYP